jgi:hypothetical protein
MKATPRMLSLLMVLFFYPSSASAQTLRVPTASPKPELGLSIVLDKEAYSQGEKLFTKSRFTNTSEETLCFPEPPQGEIVAKNGVLSTTVTRPDGSEDTEFLKLFDARATWPREKLVQEIKERWIWLRPTESYVTKSVQRQFTLSTPGEWRIHMSYRPPEGSFQPTEHEKYLRSAAKSVGCVLPQTEIQADPVIFNVSQ